MEVQDGFIIGIFNYCDRWCETCAFTSRCRVFADRAALEAEADPGLKALAEAPPLPEDIPPPAPLWMQELIEEMNKLASEPISDEELERYSPRSIPEHQPIEERAHAYADRVDIWLTRDNTEQPFDPTDPRAVVGWFQYSIPAKIHRALQGLASDDPDLRDWPADHDGSAKVALCGIERSHAAWLQLVESGMAAPFEVEPLIADLIWLTDVLDRVFPDARSFVRPGFDEPDEVAKLLAADGLR